MRFRKLLIVPWFGPLPSWFKLWAANIAQLADYGYDVHFTQDQQDFNRRAKQTLGISDAISDGNGYKVCDYRCTFGVMYADLLDGYEFWGTTDLDMVYGRVEHFLNDTRLSGLDLFSNHKTYVSGPWSLYRNTPLINEMFKREPDWRGYLTDPETSGWVEQGYSRIVEYAAAQNEIQILYESFQAKNLDNFDTVHWDEGRLMEGRDEIMVAHFRRVKEYPARCMP